MNNNFKARKRIDFNKIPDRKRKFTPNQVIKIRTMSKEGVKKEDLAELLNVHVSTISRICNYSSWKEIPFFFGVKDE